MKFALPATVFLGAFLLFQVQPLFAKAILPWFGGAPAVWTTCMLFFQALLLGGYAYAHASTSKLAPRTQAFVHLGLLALALATLPIVPSDASRPTGDEAPVPAILRVLAGSIGLPYFALAGSGPLLQAWFARSRPGASPYRLYALSNAGSLLGLVGYPFAVEPWLSTRSQAWLWSASFGGFVLLCALAARDAWSVSAVHASTTSASAAPPSPRPTWRERALWTVLAAAASALLLAVTNQMCQEVAVVPLLWVVPLALYLVTFVLCFENDRWYSRSWNLPVLILSLTVLTQAAALGAKVGIWYGVPIYSAGLFVICMFCHGELAARRPEPAHLTGFYLTLALGGVCGGLFVALIAPLVFDGFDELYVVLFVVGLLALAFVWEPRDVRIANRRTWHPTLPALVAVVLIIGAIFTMRMLVRSQPGSSETRNFFGILRVQDLPAPDGNGTMRYLTHGGTRHGQQYQDAERRDVPTAYFGVESGIGLLLSDLAERDPKPKRVGILGLGAGVIAAHGRAGDVFRFYEINPLVIEVARREFTFLADSRATTEVVAGDARLALERESEQRFDVLVLDVFSSDAIPMHLLTVQAFELYLARLAPDGLLALHLTSRHLDLGPVVAGIAGELGLETLEVATPKDEARAWLDARWILVARSHAALELPRVAAAGRPLDLAGKPPLVFTDDYSNLFSVLK